MDYRVLGPLEVSDGDRPIALGGEKQRALLAVLLLHAGEVVSAERLIDALWGERTPGAAHNALQIHVSRLRKALDGSEANQPQATGDSPGTASGGVLVTRGSGYVLRVQPGELDLERFQAAVEAGREALAAGDAQRAAESLREGLGLWRGPPLADFLYEPFAAASIGHLEELRLAALEDRVEAELALGRHEQLIGELSALVAENPLRERLRGQLMLALYRCGRQAEALDVYQQLRHMLAEELGLDPGPRLHQLQAAILERDPSLELQGSGGTGARGGGAGAGVSRTLETPMRDGRAGGFRAFLLADIRGYSSFAAAHGDEAAAALTGRFDAVAERVLGGFGGESLGNRGDEVLFAFGSPRQAIRGAVAFELALLEATRDDPSLPLPAGVGLDVGEAVAVPDGWRANAINVAARLCSLAKGGEILATREVSHLAQAIEGVRYVPLRPVRLKGIPREMAAIRIVADAGDPAQGFAQLGLTRAAAPPADGISSNESLLEVCPFKGLAFFDRADAEYFCGRERLVSDLVARLVESPLVGILGPSGIGKSSLLRAGVLPALSAGALPGSASWCQLVLRPGERPCAALRQALEGEPLDRVLQRLPSGERIVIAVDQLEELFTVCELEEERAAFLEQLVAAARDRDRRALVVCALRADFYGRLASFPLFAELLSSSHVLVAPMGREELARAIEQPAARAGFEVERALVEALVSDVAGEPGGLPLLSTTLLELWRANDGGALRYDSYRISGGVHGAVARLAEAAYTHLDEAERRIARSLMLRLAADQQGALVRRRVPHKELVRQDGADPVLAALIDARLLTVNDGEVELAHEALLREWPRYRTWLDEDRAGRRLHAHLASSTREWDTRGRDPGDLYRGARLSSTLEWATQHEHELNLPERQFLDASRHHAARATRRLHGILLAIGLLLLVSLAAAAITLISRGQAITAETTADAARLAALSETQLPIDPERAVLLAIAAVRERPTYGPTGTMFALRAALDASTIRYRLPPAGDQSCGVFNPVFDPSPGSNLVAASLCDGKVRFLDARTGRLERVVTLGSPNSLTYLNYGFAGHHAVLVGFVGGGRLGALDPTTGAVIRRGPTLPTANEGLITPDYANAPLVAAYGRPSPGDPGVYVVWNYRTGQTIWVHPPLPTAYGGVFSFAGPGQLAITFQGVPSGLGLALYDYVNRRVLATRRDNAGNVVQSPDGRTLAVGLTRADGTGTIEMANARTLVLKPGFHPPTLAQGVTYALAFSRDGRFLAYGLPDGSAGVLDAPTGATVNTYAGTPDFVSWVAISPDNRLVLTSSPDGTAQAYRLGGRALRTFPHIGVANQFLLVSPTHSGFAAIASPGPRRGEGIVVERYTDVGRAVGSPLVISNQTSWLDASLSPDGTLATDAPGNPATAQSAPMSEWSVPGRRIVRTITFPNGPSGGGAISPTDSLLITGPGSPCCFQTSGPTPVMLIDLRTGRRRTLPTSAKKACPWQAFAFSRTGTAVAAANQCGQEGVWDTVTGRPLGHPIKIPSNANALAFSPAGSSLAIASANGTVYVAPVPLTRTYRSLNASTLSVQGVAYSPDGSYLASVGGDGTARIYDARSLAELRLIQLPKAGQGLAFTTNSQDLLTWDATGTVTLWDACSYCENPSALLNLARSRVTRSLTPAERREFGVR
jgi:DNA-binding SARP family transcriptional activator/class 3 adenylate cyclase/WD40 repeat protein